MEFLHWFQAGFAWFGGMLAGIAMLMWQGRPARFKGPSEGTLGRRVGALRMLDLAAPAAAIGYGVGRIGCLTSGDGDYGIKTTLPWGVHMAKNALVADSSDGRWCSLLRCMNCCFHWCWRGWLWQGGEEGICQWLVDGRVSGVEWDWGGFWWSLCGSIRSCIWG